jgi:hypothetical protein
VAPRRGVQTGDEAQFKKSVDEQFEALDLNKDEVLLRGELKKAFESMRLIYSLGGSVIYNFRERRRRRLQERNKNRVLNF